MPLSPYCLSFFKLQSIAAAVDHHRVAFEEVALEHPERERIEHQPLNRALERPRAVDRIVSFTRELFLGRFGELDVNFPLLEAPDQTRNLNVDDPLQVLAIERMEEDDLVDAVEELGPEVVAQRLGDLAPHPFVDLADHVLAA